MELYFYEDCEYCQAVFETIAKLKISDEFTFKDIRVNPDYAKELIDLSGNVTVHAWSMNKVRRKKQRISGNTLHHILTEVSNTQILQFCPS